MNRHLSRGMTLYELLIFCTLTTIIAMFTAKALIHSRLLRGRAEARSTMILIAQEQLDLQRRLPSEQVIPGSTKSRYESQGLVADITTTITAQPDGLLMVNVLVEQDAHQKAAPVELATLTIGAKP